VQALLGTVLIGRLSYRAHNRNSMVVPDQRKAIAPQTLPSTPSTRSPTSSRRARHGGLQWRGLREELPRPASAAMVCA
jgi:hypothetical protein